FAALMACATWIASSIIVPVTMETPTHTDSSSFERMRSRKRGSTVESMISTVYPLCSSNGASASKAKGGAASMLRYDGKNSRTLSFITKPPGNGGGDCSLLSKGNLVNCRVTKASAPIRCEIESLLVSRDNGHKVIRLAGRQA